MLGENLVLTSNLETNEDFLSTFISQFPFIAVYLCDKIVCKISPGLTEVLKHMPNGESIPMKPSS